jgi:hypothetical protein
MDSFAQDTIYWWDFVNTAMNLSSNYQIPDKEYAYGVSTLSHTSCQQITVNCPLSSPDRNISCDRHVSIS